jgi:lycopene beta-cyclase
MSMSQLVHLLIPPTTTVRGRPSQPIVSMLLALWLLTMITIPILRWTIGDAVLRWGVMVSVVALAAGVGILLWQRWDETVTLRVLVTVLIGAWAVEWIGSSTGFPFGAYTYTDLLQPQLLHVPLLIPLAWLMMLPAAWAVGYAVTGTVRGWRFVGVSALAFTAWDLFLDPQMVVIYTATWLLQTIGQWLFWQMPGPALCGFVAMGVFVVLAWRAGRSTPQFRK